MDEAVRIRLRDIRDNARRALDFLGDRAAEDLEADPLHAYAILHAVQIVGEAAGRVPAEVRDAAPSIAWRASVAMRNILVHDYSFVSKAILVDTVRGDFPALIEEVQRLLGEDQT
ncbi:DUF86 domain-containing protein [Brevundimonas sp. LM2]|uniref:HepT-like ribonuclease domain-containing protein n=1 Tax=Brevundimonas sp. LM2 TaxID=1938605 RepID=UPI0015C57B62|nr:HepT-like ribonuclease domain-containing protein [Brevundimonas sp. LM2]